MATNISDKCCSLQSALTRIVSYLPVSYEAALWNFSDWEIDGQIGNLSKVTESEGKTEALEIEDNTVVINSSTYRVKRRLGFMPSKSHVCHTWLQPTWGSSPGPAMSFVTSGKSLTLSGPQYPVYKTG